MNCKSCESYYGFFIFFFNKFELIKRNELSACALIIEDMFATSKFSCPSFSIFLNEKIGKCFDLGIE